MANYKVIYRTKNQGAGAVINFVVALPNIKSLAKYLNGFVKRNQSAEVMTVYIVNDNGEWMTSVRFLRAEFNHQKWLSGYKERLLAKALEQGYKLNWNPAWK